MFMGTSLKKRTVVTLFPSLRESREQGLFLKRLGSLLNEGFSLKEALSFLYAISSDEKRKWMSEIIAGLEKGSTLHEELLHVGFPERICTQLYFSLIHGKFSQTVERSGKQLLDQVEKRKKLMQILNYPVLLVFFMVAMLFAMRFILLPHLQQIVGPNAATMSFSTQAILMVVYTAPYWIIGMVAGSLIFTIGMNRYLKRRTAIERLNIYCRFPLVHSFLKLYWTQFFVYEWGQLLKNGCSMKEIILIMQERDAAPFLQEASKWMESEMGKGKSFKESLVPFSFLQSEVGEIISHGEASGNLGIEFMLFAQECEEELTQKIERLMERIQPMIFIFVALMIIAIYAALLLPTFSLLEGL